MGYSFKSRRTKYLVKEEIRTSDYRVSSEARKRLCYVSLTHFSAFPDHIKKLRKSLRTFIITPNAQCHNQNNQNSSTDVKTKHRHQ